MASFLFYFLKYGCTASVLLTASMALKKKIAWELRFHGSLTKKTWYKLNKNGVVFAQKGFSGSFIKNLMNFSLNAIMNVISL